AKAIIFPIFSKFIGSEISDKSLERLRKKRNFAISVDKSPVLLITVGRNGYKTSTGCIIYFSL
ncbi:hypothetical protein, partial [uncultured Bacteroides sp.]|uniref:hypothetical protein n=1 Tax=uncultured Bacteroides sp. TaxID=162156 RepID=UPI002621C863